MVYALIVVTGMVTIASAVRSTWSPCGLSMLATITPLSQRGRGHGYLSTVAWFVTGSTLGGATLGAGMAAISIGLSSVSLTPHTVAAIVVGTSVVAAASDVGVGGFRLPVHHRQVNERWLDQFRPWVYGAGFGWQIGTGLATYIRSASVYLMIVLGAFGGNPWRALAYGTLFGLVRGCAVLLGRDITSAETLRAFHLRFERLGPVVRRVTIAVELASGLCIALWVSSWVALGLATMLLVWAVIRTPRRTVRRAVDTRALGRPSSVARS
jgi:hypothetical protein